MSFKVSVVIPVYNAVQFVEKAIESAVREPEVSEVILVDDGYPGNSAEKCQELAGSYPKVRLFRHPNGENRGAGASRNLGVQMAASPYIAFLDADDYYLPGRFKHAAEIFLHHSSVDAVYEPVGTEYASDEARRRFCAWRNLSWDESFEYVTYPVKPLEGRSFFYSLLEGNNGFPHINGITVKRKLFDKAGFFNASLKLHQDAEWWIRAAYHGFFSSGGHSANVAMRFAHSENRISHRSAQSMYQFNKAVYDWSNSCLTDRKAARLTLKNYVVSRCRYVFRNGILVKFVWRIYYVGKLLLNPKYWAL